MNGLITYAITYYFYHRSYIAFSFQELATFFSRLFSTLNFRHHFFHNFYACFLSTSVTLLFLHSHLLCPLTFSIHSFLKFCSNSVLLSTLSFCPSSIPHFYFILVNLQIEPNYQHTKVSSHCLLLHPLQSHSLPSQMRTKNLTFVTLTFILIVLVIPHQFLQMF